MAAKEALHIRRDPRTLALGLVMPVVMLLLFGAGALVPAGWVKPILFIVLSPLIGFALGLAMMVAIFPLRRPLSVDELSMLRG